MVFIKRAEKMEKIKQVFLKFKIKSIYLKWILQFTFLIIFAQLLTFGFIIKFVVPEASQRMSKKLYIKAEFLKSMDETGIAITKDIFNQTGDFDLSIYILEDEHSVKEIEQYASLISFDMLKRAEAGEIVISYFLEKRIPKPFCLVALKDKTALITLNIFHNELIVFVRELQKSIFIGASIGSVCIVIALIVVIHPIKKVSNATKEVAKGNFNVELQTRSCDEIGQLINNFNRMAKELQKNEYLRKDFVSSVSHEFKTPVTSIKGFAVLLKNKHLTEVQLNEYTDIIVKESTRLSNLSENLLKLSLLDSGGFEPKNEPYYLDEQIRNVILLLEKFWEEKELEFDIEMDEVYLNSNEELLSHVWINLIQNAIKFSPLGGTIKISVKENENYITVSVKDQGPGISPKDAENVFKRFYKADKSRTNEGNGLGLSIVKKVLDTVKGNIVLENTNTRGAVFTVTLPK